MMAGKNQGSQAPTAFGSMLQASTYGMTIPEIYGRTQSPLLAIWAQNLRQGGSVKKFKQMKKGITAYCENIDFLLGKNPLLGVLQMWNNGAKYPLNFTSYQVAVTAPGANAYTIPDSHFYAVIGVTLTQNYSQATNDYGAQGSGTLSGSFEVPLWNRIFAGSDPTDSHDFRSFPFCYRWEPSYGATVYLDDFPAGALPGGTLTIYYAQLMDATSYQTPVSKLRLAFENILGSGDEYDGFSSEQIQYPWYAGLGSQDIDLGSAGAIPSIKAEVQGKWGIYPTGDCDFVDIIEDICKSGIAQAAIGADLNFGAAQHGVGCWDFPGCIQKKMATSNLSSGLPSIPYDMPNTAGNVLIAVASGAGALSISDTAGNTWTPVLPGTPKQQVWYAAAVGGANAVSVAGAGASSEALILEVGGVGNVTGVLTRFRATASNATGLVTKNYSNVLQPGFVASVWSNFRLLASLPSDAVIQGIYPVLVASGVKNFTAQGLFEGDLSFTSFGLSGGSSFGSVPGGVYASTEFYGSSIGASLAALSGRSIAGQLGSTMAITAPGDDTMSISAVGYAIYYTSSVAPEGSSPIPAPFTPPAGQYVAWALPAAFTGYGDNSYSGSSTIWGTPSGSQSASGTVSAWQPSSNSSDPVVTYDGSTFTVLGSSANAGAASASASVIPGRAAYLLAVPFYSGSAPSSEVAQWKQETPPNFYGNSTAQSQLHSRLVKNPGSYAFNAPGTAVAVATLAVQATQPPTYPNPLPAFIDRATRELARAQCRAGGLWGSLSMNAQQAASDWIKDLCDAADIAPVWSGFRLKLMPRSEVSAAGNGAIYTPPTAAGPVADLDVDNGDFVATAGQPAIKCTRTARTDTDTVLQMQHLNRASDYQQVVTAEPDPAGIALYGVRKKDPTTNNVIQDVSIARSVLRIQVRRLNYVEPLDYEFTLNARWGFLESMDLVTITDRSQGIVKVPVRLTSTEDNERYELACEAEPFIYGIHAPQDLPATSSQPYSGSSASTQPAGDVNAPIIFEPVPRLYSGTQAQLWLVISSPAANYGGAQVYVSTDGGASYNPLGDPVVGSAVTGETAADWPAAADPDSVDDLLVDLTESNGTLDSYAVTDEDNFVYPCYVEGQQLVIQNNGTEVALLSDQMIKNNGALVAESGTFGYELMTYALAQLTAANKYTLKAAGGNHLRRDVFSAPDGSAAGIDHPAGSRWAFLSPAGAGILKISMDTVWAGQTLYFKICSFNSFGAAAQNLSDVPAYSYTPTGVPSTV